MLAGGSALLLAVIAVIFVAAFKGNAPPQTQTAGSAPKQGTNPASEVSHAALLLTDAAFLEAAEPLAKKFLDATRVDELLPLVRHREETGPRMAAYYPDGTINPVGLSTFNSQGEIIRDGSSYMIGIATRDFEDKAMSFVNTPEGLRIDWESWVGWSELGWEEFLAKKPTVSKLFRVNLTKVEYYNMAFGDDTKWQSHRLLSPDGMSSLYGYSERGSVLNTQLHIPPESTAATFTLKIRFPDSGDSRDQVIIEQVVAEGWVLDKEIKQ